jgi:uncharacterized protein YcgI (DUF1989 family)
VGNLAGGKLLSAVQDPRSSFIIGARSAKAFTLQRGERFRIVCVEGPQVADVNVYNADNLDEYFSAGATRRLQGIRLTEGGVLVSNPGRERPMLTLVADTVRHLPGRRGAQAHCLVFPRCTRAIYEHWCGDSAHPNCQDQLAAAISEYGLSPDRTHDTLNVFQKVGVEEDGSLFLEECDARLGDYVEFRAEMDCLVNISACPADAAGGAIPAAVNRGEPKPLKIEFVTSPKAIRL